MNGHIDREVHELSVTQPDGDPIKQMESMVQMFEDEILEWERMRTVHPDSATETCSDLAQEPTSQELVEVLEKILAEAEAAEYPEPGPIDTDWTRQVLRQATKVSCMAREICDGLTKAEWQPCVYSNYMWSMEQEIRHLYTCFGGPGEEEMVARAQRRAKVWLAKALEDVERARDRTGLHLQEVT